MSKNTEPFVKMIRNSKRMELILKNRPTAFALLAIIANRARRTDDYDYMGLEIGQALIGGHESYNVRYQIYRGDKQFLKKHDFATFKPTARGTIAALCDNSVFDINATGKLTSKPTDNPTGCQQAANKLLTTNKNVKNVKNEKEIDIFLAEFNKLFGSSYRVTEGRDKKLGLRLGSFSFSQILEAVTNLSRSKFHRGENDRHWKADPDYLLRSDEQIDRWLNVDGTGVAKTEDPTDPLVIAGLKGRVR